MTLQFSNVHSAFDSRARAQNQSQNVTGGTRRLAVFVDTVGTGEGLMQIDFPVRFKERPAFSFGWEVKDNAPLILGSYPTASIGVFRWKVDYAAENGLRIWLGATMCVVVTGPDEQAETLPLLAHCLFEARTLQGGD